MAKKRPWKSPWRRKPTPEEWAETAQMMREYLARQPHAPASAEAREKAVQDLLGAFRESAPKDIIAELYHAVVKFSDGTKQQDDLTAVIIKRM